MKILWLRNEQRGYAIHTRLLRQITRYVVQVAAGSGDFELGLHLVAAPEITRVNEQFLRHAGSTDVITFDYREPGNPQLLAGELVICVDEAAIQAKRFQTTWESEIIRYIIHGLLHLRGFDDRTAPERRKMKREEERLLEEVSARFPLHNLRRSPDIPVRSRARTVCQPKPAKSRKAPGRKRTTQ